MTRAATSTGRARRAVSARALPLAAAAAAILLGVLFALSLPPDGGAGLPMDDAYIHLAFARNLARGEIAFNHGDPAAGTTSLGWDVLLAPAFVAGGNGVAWALVLSVLSHGLAAFAFARIASRALAGSTLPEWTPAAAAFLFVANGPLLWYASSGMETSLFLAAGLLALDAFARGGRMSAALWCGVAVFIRVEGLALAAILAVAAMRDARAAQRPGAREAVKLLLIPAAFYLPAIVANIAIEKSPFPSTLQGRVMLQTLSFTPFDPSRLPKHLLWWAQFVSRWIEGERADRVLSGAAAPAASALRMLVPLWAFMLAGLVALVFLRARRPIGLLLAWTGVTVLAYGCVLPGIAYAGRYEPMVVPLLCLGAAVAVGGLVSFLRERLPSRPARAIASAMLALLAAHALLMTGVWWQVRKLSAAHIARVHVAMGRFVQTLPAEEVVAAFDIGAVKHLNPGREIVDWAGLTDSKMRRAIRDGRGAEYLRSKRVAYLAAMEGAEGSLHRYPFDLAAESREGRMAFTQEVGGGATLPSYATPPEEYARFIEAVLVAEARMTMYRVEWP